VERLLHEVWFGTSIAARAGAAMLVPLSLITARESARRRAQIRSLPAPSTPVIVVGNLVVGGAGKTPLAIAISRGLRAHGHQVGLLCSGYRGARKEARLVPPSADAGEHGDEAVLLARAGCGPVAAGRHRGEAFAVLLREHPSSWRCSTGAGRAMAGYSPPGRSANRSRHWPGLMQSS
jgi:tetraacyldisaccharide-1-P 4'-kinase